MSGRIWIMRVLIAMLCALLIASAAFSAPAQPAKPQMLNNQDVGKAETVVGDIVADAFRTVMHADIALVSAGDLKPLSVAVDSTGAKAGDFAALLMYPDDALVVLALDGGMIRQALEASLSGYPQPSLSFLQISGAKVVFDPARPVGQRVTSVTIANMPIVNEKSYTVAMVNSLANGALGYWKVWSKRNIVTSSTASTTATAAVESFLKTNPKIDYRSQGRIVASK